VFQCAHLVLHIASDLGVFRFHLVLYHFKSMFACCCFCWDFILLFIDTSSVVLDFFIRSIYTYDALDVDDTVVIPSCLFSLSVQVF
ncbi:MAG: hypothetical protein ACI8RD_012327, partial [Bacillariaceae sp.]|jgi:hypothetical protein